MQPSACCWAWSNSATRKIAEILTRLCAVSNMSEHTLVRFLKRSILFLLLPLFQTEREWEKTFLAIQKIPWQNWLAFLLAAILATNLFYSSTLMKLPSLINWKGLFLSLTTHNVLNISKIDRSSFTHLGVQSLTIKRNKEENINQNMSKEMPTREKNVKILSTRSNWSIFIAVLVDWHGKDHSY
jgi:hypothetical protein